jgi:hypothetical protein
LYVEGHGAIFFLNVNYSLTPPTSKPDEGESKPKAERDSEWEKARRELANPRGGYGEAPEELGVEPKPRPAPEYDADKVEALQKNVAQALKNAGHIRALKSDETVSVVVSSRSSSPAMKPVGTGDYWAGGSTRGGGGSGGGGRIVRTGSGSAPSGQKLIIRAKKSDIEAFSNDKLSLDEFRKKLTVFLG